MQDATVNPALTSTPALQQALYIQQLAAQSLNRTTPTMQSGTPSAQASVLETTQQQQVRCTAIKALLQLSPLLAEEASPGQAAADVLINCCLLPGDGVSPRAYEDLDGTARELQKLSLFALLALSPQPQSVLSLLTLSPKLNSSSAVAVHDSRTSMGHALMFWLDNKMLTGWQLKQVCLEATNLKKSSGSML